MNSFDMAVIFLTDSVCDIYPTAEYQEIKKEARRILSQATKSAYVNNMLDVLDGNCPDEYIYVGF